MATELGVAYLSIAASTGGLGKDIEKSLGASGVSAGKQMGGGIVSGVRGAIGPLAAIIGAGKLVQGVGNFLRSANNEARESQKVNAITANVIKQTGAAAKVTAGQVGDLATAISNKTGIDDEAVQASANLLLTFKQIRNEAGKGNQIFNRATAAAQDLAAAGFGDANSAAKMLGKALNDPAKGMTALSRAGVTFTAEQQKQVKAMVKSGDLLGAQKIIMKEVESQVGGSAAASSTAAEKIAVKWGNLKETFGTAFVIPAVDYISKKLSPVLDVMSAAIPRAQAFIKSFMAGDGKAGLLATLGSVLTLLSPLKMLFAAIQPLLPQLGQALMQVGSQVAAILLPVLEQMGPVLQQVATAVTGSLTGVLTALLPVLMQVVQAVLPVLGQAVAAIVPVVLQLVQALLPVIGILNPLISALLPSLASLITGLLPAIMPLIGVVLQVVQALMPVVGIIIQLVQTLIPPLMAVINALIPPIVNLVTTIAGALAPILTAVVGIIRALLPVLSTLIGWLAGVVSAVLPVVAVIAGGLINVIARLIGWIGNVAAAIANWVAGAIPAIGGFVTTVGTKIGEAIGWFMGLPGKIMGALGDLGNLLVSSGQNLVDGFLKGIKGAWDGLVGWVKQGMDNLRGLWPFSPAKWGPFSGRGYVTYSGQAIGEDFAASLRAQQPKVQAAAASLMGATAVAPASLPELPIQSAPAGSVGAGMSVQVNGIKYDSVGDFVSALMGEVASIDRLASAGLAPA